LRLAVRRNWGLAWWHMNDRSRALGKRAFGCGRWASALTEFFHSYVRSLTRAPLGLVRLLRPVARIGILLYESR